MAYNRARNESKRAMEQSLLTLMQHKPFENISVNEIIDGTHLTRSSFYRYYDDKYDLLEHIENELLQEMDEAHVENNPFALTGDGMSGGLQFYRNHADKFVSLLGPNGDRAFEYKIKKQMSMDYNQKFDHKQLNVQRRFIQEAMLEVGLYMIRYFVANPEMKASEMVAVMNGIMRDGAVETMKKIL